MSDHDKKSDIELYIVIVTFSLVYTVSCSYTIVQLAYITACTLSVVKMIFPALLCLLLTNLVGVSSQQTSCTREGFQAGAVERVSASVGSEATNPLDISINETYYNCLATSETIGDYTTMSVSLLYTILSTPDTLREIRYVMLCINGAWNLAAENNTALRRNDTRTDCYQCTDTADNEDYCSREYY